MKKRALIAIPAILVTLLVILLVAPNFINWEQYRAQAQQQIKSVAGYDVTINGDFGVSFLPMPHAYIGDVSIAAPAGSANDKLITLKRADVYVALMPLFSKKVEFTSIKLVEPVVALQVFEDGRQNWMTPELQKLTAKDTDGEVKTSGTSVSFKDVSIEKGSFEYRNKSAAAMVVSDIDADLEADTLKGPFKLDGDITYNKQEISFNGTVGEMISGQPFKTKVQANIKPSDINIEFAGIAQQGEKFSAQGETKLIIPSLKKVAGDKLPAALAKNDKVEISGMMTASPDAVQFKNTTFLVAGEKLSGDLSADLSPLKIQGRFQGKETVNLDSFIPQGEKKKSSANLNEVLPQTMTMPMPFEADVAFIFPSATYRGETYKDVVVQAAKGDRTFAMSFKAGSIPGNGNVDAKATLNYAEKKGEVYSNPNLTADVKAQSQNIPATIKALSGAENISLPASWNAGNLDGQIILAGNQLQLKNTKAKLGETTIDINGSYAPGKERPLVTLDVNVDQIDFDSLQQQQAAQKQKAGAGGSFESPYDVNFDVAVQQAKLKGYALKGLNAQGSLSGKMVKLTNLAVNDYQGLKAQLSGTIPDIGTPTNIDNIIVKASHANMAQAMRIFAPGAPDYVSWHKPMNFYAEVKTEGKVYRLANMKGDLAGATLAGNLSFDQGGTKPVIKGDLTFGNLVMISANSAAAKGGSTSGPRWSGAPIDSAWMHAFNADLSIKATAITYETWNLQNPVLKFSVQDGTVKIAQLDSDIYGGKMAVNATLVSPAGGKGALNVDGAAKFTSVRVEDLMKSLVGNKILQGEGDVSLDTSIKSSGASQSALVSNLGGSGTVTGQNITLHGFDLAEFAENMSDSGKVADRLLDLGTGAMKGGSTSFDKLDGNYNIAGGIINIQKLDLTGKTANLATTGNVDLPKWMINTTHKITLTQKPDVPPFTVTMNGSLDNPGKSLGQAALQGYLQQKLEKKVGKLVEDKLGDKLGDKLPGGLGGLLGLGSKTPTAATTTTPVVTPTAPAATTPQPAATQQPAPAATTPAPAETPPATVPVPTETTPAAVEPAAAPAPESAPAAEPAPPVETPPPAEAAPAESTAPQTPEDAMKDALKGLLSQ